MAFEEWLEYFDLNGCPAKLKSNQLLFGDKAVAIRDDIPRFTPDMSYSGNFQLLRDKHSTLQLDSQNGTTDRRDTILRRTQWPVDYFAGKTVLECGCGAGPDTEILLSLGCRVMSVDLAGVDVAQKNLGKREKHQLVQASIADLPLKKKSFDIVFCHRVLQHTPDPETTLRHILPFAKDKGAVFVHSYANSFFQRCRWKYLLLPLTRRMPPHVLYRAIRSYAKVLYPITTVTNKNFYGKAFNWVFVPLLNYRHLDKFRSMSDAEMFEYAVHDTFDALSPRYDKPINVKRMRSIAEEELSAPYEVYSDKNITLLRSKFL